MFQKPAPAGFSVLQGLFARTSRQSNSGSAESNLQSYASAAQGRIAH